MAHTIQLPLHGTQVYVRTPAKAKRNTANVNKQTVCQYCGKQFLHSRVTAKYCSDTCRKAMNYQDRKEKEKQLEEYRRMQKEQEIQKKIEEKNLMSVIKGTRELATILTKKMISPGLSKK